jgi:hypothetical protein
MGVIDLAFLGHLGTNQLAASSAASIAMRVTGVLLWGSTGTLNTLCSQALGAQNFRLVGIWLQSAMVVFTIMSLFVMVGMTLFWAFRCCLPLTTCVQVMWCSLTEPLLKLLKYDDDLVPQAKMFSYISALWVWPNAMYMSLRWYFQAQVEQALLFLSWFFFKKKKKLVCLFPLAGYRKTSDDGQPFCHRPQSTTQLLPYSWRWQRQGPWVCWLAPRDWCAAIWGKFALCSHLCWIAAISIWIQLTV